MTNLFAYVAGIDLAYFTIIFLFACLYKNYAVADIAWGFGFVVTSLVCAYAASPNSSLFWAVSCLIFLWGSRLSTHIYFRNKGKPEDFRYRQLREKWTYFPYFQAYIKLFLSQAFIMFVVSTCIMIAALSNATMNGVSWIFFSLAVFGFLYETISDYQLTRFKSKPSNQGKIMTQGLWSYSRHPNYFGEIIFWWGLSIMVAISSDNPIALVSGLTMNWLIVFVSGVPMLEAKYKSNTAYADYIQSTNSLLPRCFKKIRQ